MRGDYINDRQFKIDFQEQLNQFWLNKDKQLQQYYSSHSAKESLSTKSCKPEKEV